MRRVRVALNGLSPGERRLEGDAAFYLTRVHRLGAGDAFVAFDPAARREARAEIVRVDREAVTCRLGESEPSRAVPPREVTLVQCIGKGDKLDEVVRAATALGATAIVAAESSRSVPRGGAERLARKAERWRAVAVDAARQSGRGDVPEIEGPRNLELVLSEMRERSALKLCLDPDAATALREAVTAGASSGGPLARRTSAVILLIGPEGGLTGGELALADRAGFSRVRLGPFVLRTELAASAALGALVALTD